MKELNQDEIRTLAYQLWERDGWPEGKDDQYWHAAEKLLLDEGDNETAPEIDEELPVVMPIPPTRI